MIEPFRIFIGYDEREVAAYHTLAHSIISRASIPVTISPLVQSTLRAAGLYTRERTELESTAFSFSRFLVPHLSGYYGKSLFLDCDILCRIDIAEILSEWVRAIGKAAKEHRPDPAVCVVHHNYEATAGTKFLGAVQTVYPRKNFSSVMLFDNARCRALTPDYVNTATGLELHRFQWIRDEELGELPVAYNHLVSEYAPNRDAKLVHFTLGSPFFKGYEQCEYADEWRAERDAMLGTAVAMKAAA